MAIAQVPDWLLVERSRVGDNAAFDALFQRHQRQAFQFAYRLTRDPDEAGDVVATAMARMFRAFPQFRGHCSFSTWMIHITRNCFVEAHRSKKRRHTVALESPTGAAALIEDRSPSAFDLAVLAEEMDVLRTAIHRLPSNHQAMLIMHHSELRSYEEMARTLVLPVGTVKSRLNRARRSLLTIIKDIEEEGTRSTAS